MPRRCLLAAMLALGLAAAPRPAGAVPWFPSAPGPTFTYTYGTVAITAGESDDDFYRGWCMGGTPWGCEVQSFAVDGAGDILYRSIGYSAPAMPDPDITTFDAPLKYLDFPLETGRQWSSTAGITPWNPQAPAPPVTLEGTVLGPATVTVPAGTFDVIVVRLTLSCPDEPWRDWTHEIWLHEQLGPVNGLVSWTGVVDAGPISWGSLKASYR